MLSLVVALVLTVPPQVKFPPVPEGDVSDVALISLTDPVRDALAGDPAVGDRARGVEILFAVAADVCGDKSLDLIAIVRLPQADAGVSGITRVVFRTQGNKFVVDDIARSFHEDVQSMSYVGRRIVEGDKVPTVFVSVKRTSETGSAVQELWGFGAPKGKAAPVYRVALSQGSENTACARTFGCWAKASKGDVLLLRGRGTCEGPEMPLHADLPRGAVTKASLVVVDSYTDMDAASRVYRLMNLIPPESAPERPFVTTNGNFQFSLDSPLPRCEELFAVMPSNFFPGVKGPFALVRGPFVEGKAASAALKKVRETEQGAEAQIKEISLAH